MEKLYEDLLGLANLRVHRVELSTRDIRIYCEVNEGNTCPSCGKLTTTINQRYERIVRDLSISGRRVFLHLSVKQYECQNCGRMHSQVFNFLSKGKSYTDRQAKWIFEMSKKQCHTEVAVLLDMNAKTVENIFYSQAEKQVKSVDWTKIRRIGIDEFAFKKGHKDFILILLDLATHEIIALLPFRDKVNIISFFHSLGDEFCKQVEVYSSDMWQPFLDIGAEIFPNAQVVIDRFHWTNHLNKVLDNARKDLRQIDKDNAAFKYLKWTLVKRPEHLKAKEKQVLEEALEAAKAFEKTAPLAQIYEIKNELITIFDTNFSFEMAKLEVEFWIKKAEIIDNKHLNKFVKLLRKNFTNIINYFHDRVSNAVVEGTNNLLRTIKRVTYNMSNFEHFKARVFAWKS